MAVTILNKDKTRRVVGTNSKDATAIAQAFEGNNLMVAVSGDGMLKPTAKHAAKEGRPFAEKRDLKAAKSLWKAEVVAKYPEEPGSAGKIIKGHYTINQSSFNGTN